MPCGALPPPHCAQPAHTTPAGAREGGQRASGPDTAPPAAAPISPDPQLQGTPRHQRPAGVVLTKPCPGKSGVSQPAALCLPLPPRAQQLLVHAGSQQGDRSSELHRVWWGFQQGMCLMHYLAFILSKVSKHIRKHLCVRSRGPLAKKSSLSLCLGPEMVASFSNLLAQRSSTVGAQSKCVSKS